MENTEISRPNPTTNYITGLSGRKYFIYDSVTAGRYGELQRLEGEIHAGSTMSETFMQVEKAYEALNKSKPADAAVILNNAVNNKNRNNAGLPDRILLYCTCFINGEGENVSQWNETDAIEKVNDWKGIDIRFFFRCFQAFQLRFIQDYDTSIQNTLEVETETNESDPNEQNPPQS